MPSLCITSPSAAAAFVLVELLSEHGATAGPDRSGGWEIVVSLDGKGRGTVPACLAGAQEWLDTCGLPSTTIRLDGHTHLLKATGTRTRAPVR